ncbi:hypothetical protein [Lysobacter enzymogenes]|uniref:hypothetical protein n=1 Tax=Lysobacter enzymogenes TaxID=69 RepID=UPI000898536C|nr:hypothetical protein [Lysobacter enzymogenes]SDX52310.1 hypothetical protein SAMN05421681_10612 [Lysobacter enzymogenes]
MAEREQRQLPPNWPFATAEELAAHRDLQQRGYALLRQAHERFSDAHERRREAAKQ